MIAFILSGAIQLFVGPQSFSSTEQMKVRSSTRATSEGSEAQWKELGLMSSLRRVKVPDETSPSVSIFHSCSEPVIQEMRSGVVRAATSATQAESLLWLVEPSLSICGLAVVVMRFGHPFRAAPCGLPAFGCVHNSVTIRSTHGERASWVTVRRAASGREWADLPRW